MHFRVKNAIIQLNRNAYNKKGLTYESNKDQAAMLKWEYIKNDSDGDDVN